VTTPVNDEENGLFNRECNPSIENCSNKLNALVPSEFNKEKHTPRETHEAKPQFYETEDAKRPYEIGNAFELKVEKELRLLSEEFPERVFYKKYEVITLNDKSRVKPDFHIEFRRISIRTHYLIECQDRIRNSMAIYHKIKHIKNSSKYNKIIFVYPDQVTPRTLEALKEDGVLCFCFAVFKRFLDGIRIELRQTRDFSTINDTGDETSMSRKTLERRQ